MLSYTCARHTYLHGTLLLQLLLLLLLLLAVGIAMQWRLYWCCRRPVHGLRNSVVQEAAGLR